MDVIYHQLPVEEVISQLKADRNGLTDNEVSKRQEQYGRNTLPQPKSKSLIKLFFQQFLSPLIYVLIAAAIISVLTGDVQDAIFITAIIVINAILGNLSGVACRKQRFGFAEYG